MIEVELPDGRVVEIETDDPGVAASAAKAFMGKEQAAPAAPPTPQPTFPDGTPRVPVEGQTTTSLAPAQPSTTTPDALEAGFFTGAQGAARGVGDLVGAPVDLSTLALNAGLWGAERLANIAPGEQGIELPRITNPVGGSQNLADLGSMAAESLDIPLVDPESLPLPQRIAYSTNRFGTNALLAGGALRAPAMSRVQAPVRYPQLGDAFMRPYETGAVKPHIGDVAGATGSAAALEATREYLPEEWQGPLSDFVAMLVGGAGGVGLTAPTRAPGAVADAVGNALPDPNVPMMETVRSTPTTQGTRIPVSRGATQRAAEYVQRSATDPNAARQRIAEGTQFFADEGLPAPTTGTMSGDIGLGALEQGDRVRNPVPYAEADQRVRTAASNEVAALTPEGANPRAATEFATREANQRAAAAQAQQQTAEQAAAAATTAEQAVAQPYRAPPDKGAAARALDEVVVDETMRPRQAAKNERFADIPDVPRDATPFKEAAARVRESVGALNDPERVLPGGTLDRIDALGDNVNFQDLNKLRPELTDAIRAARREGNYTLADNIRALKGEINREVERIARDPDIAAARRMTDEGGIDAPIPGEQAADRAAEALRYFREEFAPYFGDGTIGGKLKDSINRDTDRVNTPPSATADRFLNVASGAKEAAADLRRILSIAPNLAKGQEAVRNYVLSDMAKVIDAKGTIDPRRMRDWYTKRKDMLSEFPELDAEMKKLLGDAVNGRAKSNATALELKKAIQATKMTEADIRRGNLSLLLDSSPDVAVTRVFSSNDPEKAMSEIVSTLSKDKAAAEGWKKAVSEYLSQRVSGTNTQMTDTGNAPVQFAAAKKFFDQNRNVLAKVYSAKEMNTLQRVQKLLEPFGALSRRATVGSPTAENVALANSSNMRMLEIALKTYYGMLEGGGRFRAIRLAMASLPNTDEQVGFLLNRMQFDPGLALHLLDTPVKQQGTPAWNAKLNQLLGLQQASQTGSETEDRK